MRTLAAELAAVNNGNYPVVFRVKTWQGRGVSLQANTTKILGFHISRTEIRVETEPLSTTQNYIQLLRGALINGVEYLIGTTYYTIYKTELLRNKTIFYASLIPRQYVSVAGDDTYENVLTAFCTAIGLTPQFKNPTAAFWDYQFYPAGRSLTLNDARGIVSILRQKYLITVSDQEGDIIQFAGYLDSTSADVTAPPILNNPYIKFTSEVSAKQFIWRDEANTTHQSGSLTIPAHNLGYLESTDDPPAVSENAGNIAYEGQVDLRITNDDIIYNDENELVMQADVIETFDRAKDPSWMLNLQQSTPISSTEGGALPSTIQAAAPYTPLNVSNFNHVLSANDNNIQAAMETLDEHTHTTPTPSEVGAIPNDGWIAHSNTWTRTGNHTFTVSGDMTLYYRKGTKIRYKDGGGYEYGVIKSSTVAAGTTTVTLITNSDYAMAAATITDKYISYVENPEGFPSAFNYTATVTPSTGAITSYTINLAAWTVTRGRLTVDFNFTITNNGTGGGYLKVSWPIAATAANIGSGVEVAVTGSLLNNYANTGLGCFTLTTYANAYPGGTNYQIIGTIAYTF
jgi:hypothetical protein